MDFSYLLDLAKQNEEHAKEAIQVKRYSTQVSVSKKLPKSKLQSEAIRNFLTRKDQEEKIKKLEELKKKETLLSLRAQDRKSNARVQAMLKRTKAANKAVLDDVKNSLQTSVTAAGLDVQPDEDDYGYVSQEASQFYKNLIDKYSSGPSTDDSTKQKGRNQKELCSAKDRVKVALDKIQEDETSGHRKKRTHKVHEQIKVVETKSVKELPKKPKPKPPPEAALSFDQILKLAAAKQHEPLKLDKKVDLGEKKGPEDERPMTKKEKEDLMRRKEEERNRQLRKEGKLPPITATPSTKPSSKSKEKKELKETIKQTLPDQAKPSAAKFIGQKEAVKKPLERTDPPRSIPGKSNVPRGPSPSVSKVAPQAHPSSSAAAKYPPPSSQVQQSNLQRPPMKGKSLAPPNSRPFPPYKDIRPVDRSYKRRLESDEEEEEDSELDDFIDDGPDGTEDYSKHIQEIFGYDKSRYRRIESSDEEECMESSFAQQMKEEVRSTKIGIMEDLEEERLLREEEERKKKKLIALKKGKMRK